VTDICRYRQKCFSIRRPSAILILQNFDFLLNDHHGNWNVHLYTKFDRNRIIIGWVVKIKLFSRWRPSDISNLRKLQCCSCLLYWYVILYFRSKFRINRSIWRRDIAKKRFSIWRPSAILNLTSYDFLLNIHHGNWNVHLPTKFDRNRIILGWDMKIMLFSKLPPCSRLRPMYATERQTDVRRASSLNEQCLYAVYNNACISRLLIL